MRKYLNLRANIALGLIFAFLINTFGLMPWAQASLAFGGAWEFSLPKPGVMILHSPQFNPPILKGIKVHPDNPFRFDFILDQGDAHDMSSPNASVGDPKQEQLKQQSTKLIKYFLASLTIPEQDLWVNLSPYEKNRIVPASFGQTEMGRDLLAEDYMLKQITASFIYPEDEIGKKFWKRIYEEAVKKFGTTNIPVNTFNKVWIVPEKAVVYENAKAGTAYVVESRLKVMLEQDYLALERNQRQPGDMAPAVSPRGNHLYASEKTSTLVSQIVREIVIPELTREVNEGKNFAQLRQVYNSLILAIWYKKKIKENILEQVFADKNKIKGLSSPNVEDPAYIYQQYLKAFKKGVYNYIKEDFDPTTQETVPRKYFSGGEDFASTSMILDSTMSVTHKIDFASTSSLQVITTDCAMLSPTFSQSLEPRNHIQLPLKTRIKDLNFFNPRILGSREREEVSRREGLPYISINQSIANESPRFDGIPYIYVNKKEKIAIIYGHGQSISDGTWCLFPKVYHGTERIIPVSYYLKALSTEGITEVLMIACNPHEGGFAIPPYMQVTYSLSVVYNQFDRLYGQWVSVKAGDRDKVIEGLPETNRLIANLKRSVLRAVKRVGKLFRSNLLFFDIDYPIKHFWGKVETSPPSLTDKAMSIEHIPIVNLIQEQADVPKVFEDDFQGNALWKIFSKLDTLHPKQALAIRTNARILVIGGTVSEVERLFARYPQAVITVINIGSDNLIALQDHYRAMPNMAQRLFLFQGDARHLADYHAPDGSEYFPERAFDFVMANNINHTTFTFPRAVSQRLLLDIAHQIAHVVAPGGIVAHQFNDHENDVQFQAQAIADGMLEVLGRPGDGLYTRPDGAMMASKNKQFSVAYGFTMPPVINTGALSKIARKVADHLRDYFMQQTSLWGEKRLSLISMNGDFELEDQFNVIMTLKEAINNSVNAIADKAEKMKANYGGKIFLRITLTAQGYDIELEDNGIGVKKDILKTKILNFGSSRPLILGQPNDHTRLGRFGLGTLVTRKMLQDHQGILQVDTFNDQSGSWILTKNYGTKENPTLIDGERKVPGTIFRWIIPIAAHDATMKLEAKDDRAMTSKQIIKYKVDKILNNGGIDLTPAHMNVQVKTGSPTPDNGIKFHLDAAMMAQLRNAPGFVPVIISIQPMRDLKRFLGVK